MTKIITQPSYDRHVYMLDVSQQNQLQNYQILSTSPQVYTFEHWSNIKSAPCQSAVVVLLLAGLAGTAPSSPAPFTA